VVVSRSPKNLGDTGAPPFGMKDGTSVITEIRRNFLTNCDAFRLSRSLKVIGTNTDLSATYDFLLTMSLSRTVSEINGENGKFFTPCVFNAPAKGVSIGIL